MMDTSVCTAVDKSDMLNLLMSFPNQFKKAREIGENISFEDINKVRIKNILFAGMGGSAISGDLLTVCYADEAAKPFAVSRNYFIPSYIDESSLVFVLSYSGNTEESLAAYKQAVEKKAQIICISSGGTLSEWARRDNFPIIEIPGGQPPRSATGYLAIPVLIALSRLGIISDKSQELDETQELLEKKAITYHPESQSNFALEVSQKLHNKIPIVYCSAGFMQAVALRWKCQFNENTKLHSFYNCFPELNHNEIVGWEVLKNVFNNFQIVYLHDKEDYYRTTKRMEITQSILEKETHKIINLNTEGVSRLTRAFSLIYLGDMVSYYLAIHYGVDPTPIEKINILKEQLKKIS